MSRDAPQHQPHATHAHARVEPRLAHLLVLAALAAFVLLYGLGARPLADWDEAIYAQVSKEMARGAGDWLTPTWEFQTWLEKPPLLMWTTAVFYRLFGVTEFWSRAASAFSGIGLVLLTYLLGRRLYDARTGLLSALLLLTTYHFVSFSRFGTTDVMLTCFTYLALYAFVRLRTGGRALWWYAVWLASALALMTKGAGGLLAPAAIIFALLFDARRADVLSTRHFWFALLAAALCVAPWHVLMYARHGEAFVSEYVGYHVLARIRTPLEGHAPGYLFYVLKIIDGFFPWSLLTPFAVVSSVRENLRGDARSRLLLIVAALVFMTYTLVQSKLVWYIVPIYPALALLVAAFVLKLYRAAVRRPKLKFAAGLLVALLLVAGGVYTFLLVRLTHSPAEASLAEIVAIAASRDAADREPLLLFSDAEAPTRPAALFYSNRPLRQVYLTNEPRSPRARRYERPELISSVVADEPLRIILRREDVEKLASGYELKVEAETASFVYARIARRRVGRSN
ncbi:MAG TPA: glycosyltransferase family 39 protein [Pyrinomonadaceae bacterium]|nr:glycosyltransferase family 39 protein [Pyrinomonadaceae bacterium]